MVQPIAYDRVLDKIYEASMDPEHWHGTMGAAAAFLGAADGVLLSAGPCQPVGQLAAGLDIGQIRRSERLVGPDLPFRPDVVFLATALIDRDGVSATLAVFGRPLAQGAFIDSALADLARLVPHLQRAITLSSRINRYKLIADANAAAVEAFASGIVMMGPAAEVLFANQAAHQLAGQTDALMIRKSGVFARRPGENARLQALIAGVIAGRAGGATAVTADEDGRRIIVVASPLGSNRDLDVSPASAALFLSPCQRSRRPEARWLMDVFELTSGEARAALAIAEGGELGATAERLGISINTLKTHSSRIFSKTGVRRQAELARMLAEVFPVVASHRDGSGAAL